MWARNPKNIQAVEKRKAQGVYILYDGSMPVYVGMGRLSSRLRQGCRSKRRGQMWDHFSWYVPCDTKLIRDIEALLLGMLPFPLRVLNKQKGKLKKADKIKQAKTNRAADFYNPKNASQTENLIPLTGENYLVSSWPVLPLPGKFLRRRL